MTPERWKRTEALYHAALARPPDERAAFLAEACPDDDALRREVQVLIDEPISSDRFLSEPAIVAAARLMAHRPAMAGRSLGGYHLQALLGAGGMGEVYRSRDPKLGRDVAIKILPSTFTSHPDRLARFEREARMLAALNHPNICAIHGLHEADGERFLILEFVDGETLADRLASITRQSPQTGMPLHDALAIARQIAEALELAHERGIIHRDLKPANVKITPDGVVKILDFGLAKAVAGEDVTPDLSPAHTARPAATREGVIVGTADYMSPEQTLGLPVDRRTDIWAFGVVLFEMVTGRRPFGGATLSETVGAVLKTDPDWTGLDAVVPDRLRRLLQRCLEKDPKRRLQAIGEARIQIEDVLSGAADEPGALSSSRPSRLRQLAVAVSGWTLAAILALLAGTYWALRVEPSPPDVRPQVLSVLPPSGASLATDEAPAISPDGRRLAFVGYDATGKQLLYTRTLDSATPEPLTGTDGASLPFWSPNSASIGFFAQGSLKVVDLATGVSRTLAPALGGRGGTWNTDDVIVFVPRPLDGPHRISATGEDAAAPVPAGPVAASGGWLPSFLPDGRHFLEFVPTVSQPENSGVWVTSLDSGARERLVTSRSNAIYAQPGYLLFWRDGTLWAQPFDHRQRKLGGSPVSVSTTVGLNPVTNQALFSVASSGALAFLASAAVRSELVWTGRAGNPLGKAGVAGVITTASLSPDAGTVVYDLADARTASFDLWQLVFSRKVPDRFSFDPSHDVFPVWSPDGDRIVFLSVRERPPQLYELPANSPGTEKLLLRSKFPTVPSGWSSDGKVLFYTVATPTAGGDIWALPRGGEPYPVVATPSDERYGTPSPDGRWLAYVSNESQTYEVNVRALRGSGVRRQISTGGGSQPQWRRDGRELFFMAPDKTLMSVEFQDAATTFRGGPPTVLFGTRTKSIEIQGTARTYAAEREGQRFLLVNATEESHRATITMVLNWLGGLKK